MPNVLPPSRPPVRRKSPRWAARKSRVNDPTVLVPGRELWLMESAPARGQERDLLERLVGLAAVVLVVRPDPDLLRPRPVVEGREDGRRRADLIHQRDREERLAAGPRREADS